MPNQTLASIPLFSQLSEAELEAIAHGAVTRSFPKNSVLINEGDQSDSLYVIISGRVKVYLSDEDGKEVVLSFLGEGQYFGELSLIDDTPRSASVMALEPCKLSIISRPVFERVLDQQPGLARNLLRGMAQRIRITTDNVRSLALLDVYGRIARVLIDSAEKEGGRMITGRLTQQDIANQVGSSREMVSRILKDLRSGGYITMDGKRIVIERALPENW